MRFLQKIIVKNLNSRLKLFFLILGSLFFFQSCNSFLDKNESYNNGFKAGYLEGLKDGKEQSTSGQQEQNKSATKDPNLNNPSREQSTTTVVNSGVPQKAVLVLDFIRKNNKAPEGYVGGRHFGNYEHNLPERDAAGNKIEYQEWDIQPKIEGKNRGAQRIVTGSDGSAWYTADHYQSFTEIK